MPFHDHQSMAILPARAEDRVIGVKSSRAIPSPVIKKHLRIPKRIDPVLDHVQYTGEGIYYPSSGWLEVTGNINKPGPHAFFTCLPHKPRDLLVDSPPILGNHLLNRRQDSFLLMRKFKEFQERGSTVGPGVSSARA